MKNHYKTQNKKKKYTAEAVKGRIIIKSKLKLKSIKL